MNKTDLIDAIAADADISKAAAQRALDSLIKNVIATVANDESVQLV